MTEDRGRKTDSADVAEAIRRTAAEASAKSAEDDQDRLETRALTETARAREETEADRIRSDHRRGEQFRNAVNWALIGMVYIVLAAILVMAGIWLFHLLSPPSRHWLSAAQLNEIKHLLTGGLVSTFLMRYFERKLAAA